MNDTIQLKNDLLLLEYSLVFKLSNVFNLYLNEFASIKLYTSNTKNKRDINFDTKKNDNIYQIKTSFDDEKNNLINQFNPELGKSGYLTKYNLINRDDIDKIIQKRISLLFHAKLINLVSNSFVGEKINEIIAIINEAIVNTKTTIKTNFFTKYDSTDNKKVKSGLYYVFSSDNNNEVNVEFHYNDKLWEFAKLTIYPNNFFADIDINLNNIMIFIFNKTSNKEVIQYPLTEKGKKHLLLKKGIKPL